jgi:molybdate/tungstate transport system substrate-binding protein
MQSLTGGAHQGTLAPVRAYHAGSVNAVIIYLTGAILRDLPYVRLPDEVSLGKPALAARYGQVSYTNPLGQTFRATPLVYSATIPTNAPNPEGAAAFVRCLAAEVGQAAFKRRGFQAAEALVGGDQSALPASVKDLAQGVYQP